MKQICFGRVSKQRGRPCEVAQTGQFACKMMDDAWLDSGKNLSTGFAQNLCTGVLLTFEQNQSALRGNAALAGAAFAVVETFDASVFGPLWVTSGDFSKKWHPVGNEDGRNVLMVARHIRCHPCPLCRGVFYGGFLRRF